MGPRGPRASGCAVGPLADGDAHGSCIRPRLCASPLGLPPLKRLQSSTQPRSARASDGWRGSARERAWNPIATMRGHGCVSTCMTEARG
eukprot:321851-Pyramimonas_sp.AAC.1